MGRPLRKNKRKKNIIKQYVEIAKQYIYIDIDETEHKNNHEFSCSNCLNTTEFDIIDGNIYICLKCAVQQELMAYTSSYKDIDRVNISTKYIYDRKIHFRDCINQYQGKQNSTISPDVYKDLEEQFFRHHLLVGDEKTPTDMKFENITKEHISMFLKELGYFKHYENVNLIHYNLTGVKPDDISHLEDKLLNDFDMLAELYDKRFKDINRKNFINTQYVLYQLLTRYKHKCKKKDFAILKTIDRKSFHDNICKTLFEELGWNYIPYF